MVPLTMLPGITGSLIAPTFLASTLPQTHSLGASATGLRRMHGWWRKAQRALGPASSHRAVADVGALPLFELLEYKVLRLEPCSGGFIGLLRGSGGAEVALRVCAWGADADAAWRGTVRAARAMETRWGFVYSGCRLRIVDVLRTWSHRAIDFDLAVALAHEESAVALLALLRAAGASGPKDATLTSLVEQSEQHGAAVCSTLGAGVLDALSVLLKALDAARPRKGVHTDNSIVLEQALTVVYRVLFLLFAEARAMVPTWHDVYRDSYTIDALWRRAIAAPPPPGLWKALQAIARLAHTGCDAGDLVVTPFNGRLFSPRHTPLAERAAVPDRAVAEALLALATTGGRHGRQRIAYADLGVEQLGAVYERVLEYQPARQAAHLQLVRTSHDRKSTGSFYTPRAMTDFLVRRALHPLVEGKSADDILKLRVLDPAMGSGAFLVAACRYLGTAVARARAAETADGRAPAAARLADARRDVAQRCLYGVDLNPMAVQLARLSLWLASLSSDRPLTFLDHHLATGNSLVGASLWDLTRVPRQGRARRQPVPDLPLFDTGPAEHLASLVLPERFRIATEPGDTAIAVENKERALAALSAPGTPLRQWKHAADLWCAAWLSGDSALSGGIYLDLLGSLTGRSGGLAVRDREALLARVRDIGQAHHCLHWELQFPEVFFDAAGQRHPEGGFDVVIGNPPWDVLRADTGRDADRRRARVEHAQQLQFFREARVYHHQGGGHINRYQLFLERAIQLTRPGGRLAMVLPSGLATDQGSARLRRQLFDGTHVERVVGFDNRDAIFPIHRDVRFLLLTAVKGGRTERLASVMGRSDPAWLDALPDAPDDDPTEARGVALSRATLEAWDPEHFAIPWLTRSADVAILAAVVGAVPALSDARGWGVRFGRELNATDDRHHFVGRDSATADDLLTVVEGKHLEPFRLNAHRSAQAITRRVAATLIDGPRSFERWRVAYRDVASATNRVTLIASLLPPGTVSTHTVFCSKSTLGADARYCLLALLNSLVANFLVRLHVTTHVTCALMARLPVPRPPTASHPFRELAAIARTLARTGTAGQDSSIARLNAVAAQLYGLTPAQYEHVLSTFPLLPTSLVDACAAAYGRGAGPPA